MIGVDKIEDIRKGARGGEPIASIAGAVGASEPTVRKRARMRDLSPEPPRRREPESEVLAPYEGTVDSWLDDDCRNWRKQRHTAARAYVRPRDEGGATRAATPPCGATSGAAARGWPASATAGTPRGS